MFVIKNNKIEQLNKYKNIFNSISTKLNRFWRSSIGSRYNLQGNGELRRLSLNLTYDCECFTLSTDIKRTFYEDRDLRPSDSILFRLTFKTLGEIRTDLETITY